MGRGSARLCSRRRWSDEGEVCHLDIFSVNLCVENQKIIYHRGHGGSQKTAQLFKSERCSISEGLLEDWGAQLRRRRADLKSTFLGSSLDSEFHPPNGQYLLTPRRPRLRAGRGR